MSGRDDIFPKDGWRRLSYTRRCGWVDWGHALPFSAEDLKKQIDTEQSGLATIDRLQITLDGAPAYVVSYGQEMGRFNIKVSAVAHWVVRKGLSREQRRSAALGIYMAASHRFERLQGDLPYSLVSNSSYSLEDLVSNLIGFYAEFEKVPIARMRTICGEVSVDESLHIWDTYLPDGVGGMKNRSFTPRLFPTTEGVRSPADTSFPPLLQTIRPSTAGHDWVAVSGRFIDGRLVNSGRPLDVSRSGAVTPLAEVARRVPAYAR
jgi:hypothetical protein